MPNKSNVGRHCRQLVAISWLGSKKALDLVKPKKYQKTITKPMRSQKHNQIKPLLKHKKDLRQLTVANRLQMDWMPTKLNVGCSCGQLAAISCSNKGTRVKTKKKKKEKQYWTKPIQRLQQHQTKALLKHRKDARQPAVANRPQANWMPTKPNVDIVSSQLAAISWLGSNKGTLVKTKKQKSKNKTFTKPIRSWEQNHKTIAETHTGYIQ